MDRGDSTKELILNAAKRLFSSRGFSCTTISEISKSVGVSDSTVYEHFQNKEDILFAIPREYTQQLVEINQRHLRGLLGSVVKLRKLTWNYIEFLCDNKEYATLLLFELRPNRNFYETQNHERIRRFTKPYRDVIIEGQREGVFRPELSPSLILNLIFGTIDLILITWLLENNPSDPMSLFDDFFSLLISGIRAQQLDLNAKKDKKKRILNAATKVFSQNGYAKTRIQDISRSAEIADATIYKYFSGKEEILFSLPVENTKTLLSIQKEHLNGLRDTDLKLEILLKDYLHFLDSHKDYAAIVLFDLRYNKLFYKTEGYKLFKKFSRVFFDIITEGIKKNHYRAGTNPYLATKMLFGVTDHVIISSIKFGRPSRISNLSDRICAVILSALKNDEAD